jgi:hypothetical protein
MATARKWNAEKQRNFMDGLAKQLNITQQEDWYSITSKQIYERGGGSLLDKYGSSPSKLIQTVYQDHQWNEYKFRRNPKGSSAKLAGYWTNLENQRNFLNSLGKKLGIKDLTDWYAITRKQICENGGASLLGMYNNSPGRFISSIFNEFPWDSSRFRSKMPSENWEKKENRVSLIKKLTIELQIRDLEDWYRVSLGQIAEFHSNVAMFRRYPLQELLQEAYPDFQWDDLKLKKLGYSKAAQWWVKSMVQVLFPSAGS